MSTHRGGFDLSRAINSIRWQTYRNLQIVLVDDGSDDEASYQLHRAAEFDARIELLRNEKRKGLAYSLNRALDIARGDYVARMDADDESRPDRLARQLAFLESHPEISICGTAVHKWMNGRVYKLRLACRNAEIRATLMFHTPFAHPTVMWRRADFDKHGLRYNESFFTTQDYELWTRALWPLQGANLKEYLLDYYCHSGQVTTALYKQTDLYRHQIAERVIRWLIPDPTPEQIALHLRISQSYDPFTREELDAAEGWLLELLAANLRVKKFDQMALRWAVAEKWSRVCDISAKSVPGILMRYMRSPLIRCKKCPKFALTFAAKRLLRK